MQDDCATPALTAIAGPGNVIAECLFGGPTVLRGLLRQAEQMQREARARFASAEARLLPLTGDKFCDMFRGPAAVERERQCAQESIDRIQKVIDRTRINLAAYDAPVKEVA